MTGNLVVGRFLSVGSARTPRFSNDGRRLYFACDISGVPQIRVWEGGLTRPGLGIVGISYGGYSVLACLAFSRTSGRRA